MSRERNHSGLMTALDGKDVAFDLTAMNGKG